MKGLMLKELYLTRKLRIIGAVVWFVMIVFCMLVRLSALHGNIALLGEKIAENACGTAYYILVFGGTIILYAMQFTNCVLSDEKSGFRIYEHTLPVSETKIVGAMYLVNLAAFGIVTVINWLMYLLANAVFDRPLKAMYLLYIPVIGCVEYLMVHLIAVVNYNIRSAKKASAVKCALGMGLYFLVGFGFMNWYDSYAEKITGLSIYAEEAEKNVRMEELGLSDIGLMNGFFKDEFLPNARFIGYNCLWIVPLLIAVCYFASVRGLKRRGGKC